MKTEEFENFWGTKAWKICAYILDKVVTQKWWYNAPKGDSRFFPEKVERLTESELVSSPEIIIIETGFKGTLYIMAWLNVQEKELEILEIEVGEDSIRLLGSREILNSAKKDLWTLQEIKSNYMKGNWLWDRKLVSYITVVKLSPLEGKETSLVRVGIEYEGLLQVKRYSDLALIDHRMCRRFLDLEYRKLSVFKLILALYTDISFNHRTQKVEINHHPWI